MQESSKFPDLIRRTKPLIQSFRSRSALPQSQPGPTIKGFTAAGRYQKQLTPNQGPGRPMPEFSGHFAESQCTEKIKETYYELALELNPGLGRDIVLVCIGTDRSTGDSLGPLVGSELTRRGIPGAQVYGTLDLPVHAANLESTLDDIHARFSRPFIVALDACLGQVERVGFINVRPGELRPGTAVKKELPPLGELHISGVVNIGGFLEHLVLQNTRLSLVFRMAETISAGIRQAHLDLFK